MVLAGSDCDIVAWPWENRLLGPVVGKPRSFVQGVLGWESGLQASRRGPATHLLVGLGNVAGLLLQFMWSVGRMGCLVFARACAHTRTSHSML